MRCGIIIIVRCTALSMASVYGYPVALIMHLNHIACIYLCWTVKFSGYDKVLPHSRQNILCYM